MSVVQNAALLNYQGNDADHRAFAQGVHALLVAAGLTQTADTGQANLSTILRPSNNSASGYEIFRFNDSEQAILGCFIKIEYGSNSPNTIPGLRISIGNGSNGAGVLTNTIGTTGVTSAVNVPDLVGATRLAFASYSEGQLILSLGISLTDLYGATWYIGRPRLSDGSRTTDGLIYINWLSWSGSAKYRAILRAGGGGPALYLSSTNTQLILDSLKGQDDQIGANLCLFPMYVGVNGDLRFGSLFGYRADVILADAQASINAFGGLKNYRSMGALMKTGDTAIMVPYF